MRKLLRISLLAAALVTVLCVSAMAADGEPAVAGLYNFQSAVTDAVKITPMTADSTSAIGKTSQGTGYENFYQDAVRFDVTYTNASITAGEQYLLIVCSGTGAPSESNIVYINQKASDAGKVEFKDIDRAYPSSLGKGDYRIYVVGEHSEYVQATPTATFSYHVPYVLGDANGDQVVNVTDAVKILKCIVGNDSFSGSQELAADANEDKVVNVTDAVTILKYIVGNGSLGKQ